jgi:hypothetical protein
MLLVGWIRIAAPTTTHRTPLCAPCGQYRIERLMTVIGLLVAIGALLSMIACGLGWATMHEFTSNWACLALAGTPFGPLIDRLLRPLFWLK